LERLPPQPLNRELDPCDVAPRWRAAWSPPTSKDPRAQKHKAPVPVYPP